MLKFLRRVLFGGEAGAAKIGAPIKIESEFAEEAPVKVRQKRRKLPKLKVSKLERDLVVDVRGESETNPDGVSRHSLIAGLKIGEAVSLKIVQDEERGEEFVEIRSRLGVIGQMAREFEDVILPMLHHKVTVQAEISDIRGGTKGKPNFGVWLKLSTP